MRRAPADGARALARQGLCPFAAPVRSRGRAEGEEPALRCAVSRATGREELLSAVRAELALLAAGIAGSASGQRAAPESTLLVVSPAGGSQFLAEYRDFVSTRRFGSPEPHHPPFHACHMLWATI